MNWPHKDKQTWSLEFVVNNDLYWNLVKLGADLEQTPEEYVRMLVIRELYSTEDVAEVLDKHLGAL